ncbi:hypothetical protein TSAR_008160 [Trichomalopsis sarcophagae]|uniref:Uncharacterized protein n=1 Tax=Trichomalopsis sarcophagae TaxID=543379 RepID=A0A232F9G9_9HYME|nr:hypothetical protein TSAR_008160 [Trichomalopsis sarcophagae]
MLSSRLPSLDPHSRNFTARSHQQNFFLLFHTLHTITRYTLCTIKILALAQKSSIYEYIDEMINCPMPGKEAAGCYRLGFAKIREYDAC